jgi:hypothetical protein
LDLAITNPCRMEADFSLYSLPEMTYEKPPCHSAQ